MNLSIKNAPDAVVRRLKARALRHHRSLQGELMAIISSVAQEEEAGLLTPRQALEQARAAGLRSASSSVRLVRRMREGRRGDGRR